MILNDPRSVTVEEHFDYATVDLVDYSTFGGAVSVTVRDAELANTIADAFRKAAHHLADVERAESDRLDRQAARELNAVTRLHPPVDKVTPIASVPCACGQPDCLPDGAA